MVISRRVPTWVFMLVVIVTAIVIKRGVATLLVIATAIMIGRGVPTLFSIVAAITIRRTAPTRVAISVDVYKAHCCSLC